ncbi:hypothetical protein NGB36_22870 [Streptomyces sp. RB6PN25]|uniref:Uncharacterized protein n=1 Tax=Streptomyces humicola TaxID=2953240 RepID=A0ABT1Q0B5_9ACTN|nr:hypothetical protein [Streptomyces humicola]MCQ4083368.1 hypothetical protein [Streptomyces humicola]
MSPRPALTSAHSNAPAPRPTTRLPWWAVALPALAFAALLTLVTGSGHGGSAPAAESLAQFTGRLHELLLRIM